MIHIDSLWYYMVPTIVWLTKGYTPIQQKRVHRIGLPHYNLLIASRNTDAQKCTVHLNARIDMYACACKVIFKCTCSHVCVWANTHIIYIYMYSYEYSMHSWIHLLPFCAECLGAPLGSYFRLFLHRFANTLRIYVRLFVHINAGTCAYVICEYRNISTCLSTLRYRSEFSMVSARFVRL